jgi:hypothetical protein
VVFQTEPNRPRAGCYFVPPYELYEERCVRTDDGWYSLKGGNGFGVNTRVEIWAKAATPGAWSVSADEEHQ